MSRSPRVSQGQKKAYEEELVDKCPDFIFPMQMVLASPNDLDDVEFKDVILEFSKRLTALNEKHALNESDGKKNVNTDLHYQFDLIGKNGSYSTYVCDWLSDPRFISLIQNAHITVYMRTSAPGIILRKIVPDGEKWDSIESKYRRIAGYLSVDCYGEVLVDEEGGAESNVAAAQSDLEGDLNSQRPVSLVSLLDCCFNIGMAEAVYQSTLRRAEQFRQCANIDFAYQEYVAMSDKKRALTKKSLEREHADESEIDLLVLEFIEKEMKGEVSGSVIRWLYNKKQSPSSIQMDVGVLSEFEKHQGLVQNCLIDIADYACFDPTSRMYDVISDIQMEVKNDRGDKSALEYLFFSMFYKPGDGARDIYNVSNMREWYHPFFQVLLPELLRHERASRGEDQQTIDQLVTRFGYTKSAARAESIRLYEKDTFKIFLDLLTEIKEKLLVGEVAEDGSFDVYVAAAKLTSIFSTVNPTAEYEDEKQRFFDLPSGQKAVPSPLEVPTRPAGVAQIYISFAAGGALKDEKYATPRKGTDSPRPRPRRSPSKPSVSVRSSLSKKNKINGLNILFGVLGGLLLLTGLAAVTLTILVYLGFIVIPVLALASIAFAVKLIISSVVSLVGSSMLVLASSIVRDAVANGFSKLFGFISSIPAFFKSNKSDSDVIILADEIFDAEKPVKRIIAHVALGAVEEANIVQVEANRSVEHHALKKSPSCSDLSKGFVQAALVANAEEATPRKNLLKRAASCTDIKSLYTMGIFKEDEKIEFSSESTSDLAFT